MKKFTYWLSAIIIGIALGLALQFVRAWTEPSTAPPGGNVGAPINTGAQKQTKSGDICTTVTGTEICLSTAGGGGGNCTCYIDSPSNARIFSGLAYLQGFINCGSGWVQNWQFDVGHWGSGFGEGWGKSGYSKCSPSYP